MPDDSELRARSLMPTKPSAKQRADLGPIPALYGRANPSTFGRPSEPRFEYVDGKRVIVGPDPLPAWMPDGWTRHYSCAITGPCLTGEHLLAEPTHPDGEPSIADTEPAEEVAV